MVIMYLLVCFVLFVFVAVLSFVHISQVIGSVTDCCSYTSRRVSVLSDDGVVLCLFWVMTVVQLEVFVLSHHA